MAWNKRVIITKELSRTLNLPVKEGVLIAEVFPGSPAEKAGLRAENMEVIINGKIFMLGGDIILEVTVRKLNPWRWR